MQCGLALNIANARLSFALSRCRGRGAITASSHNTACALLGQYLPSTSAARHSGGGGGGGGGVAVFAVVVAHACEA